MIKDMLRPIVYKYRAMRRDQRIRTAIGEMKGSNSDDARQMGRAMDWCLSSKMSESEAQTRCVEERREKLLADDSEFESVDYGVGEPGRNAEEMRKGVVYTTSVAEVTRDSKAPCWGKLLYGIVREFQPRVGIELGSCVGISASYQGLAMSANGFGKFYTLEGSRSVAKLARRTLEELGVTNVTVVEGPFQDTFGSLLDEVQPVDYLFIDGHHDEEATLKYFDQCLSYLAPRAVVVFDDICWSDGMRSAWEKIREHPAVSVVVELSEIGVCVVRADPAEKCFLKVPL